MRQIGHDEAVLDGAGLAFIGVADNVFHGIGLFANEIPFHAGGKSRAAHAFQFGGFELGEDRLPGLRLSELADDAVLLTLAIWIGFASDAWVLGMRLANGVALDGVAGDLFGVGGGDIGGEGIVAGNWRGMIAGGGTGGVRDVSIF